MAETVALFGEAEKGDFRTAYFFQHVSQLVDHLGNPPEESVGLHYAVQALLMEQQVIFFRVEEEGFSIKDYMLGLKFLEQKHLIADLTAVFLPGVGSMDIIDAVLPICDLYDSVLIMTESDLYDYMTSF
jgi:hypothetical protein